jgi:hypothetical protein
MTLSDKELRARIRKIKEVDKMASFIEVSCSGMTMSHDEGSCLAQASGCSCSSIQLLQLGLCTRQQGL